MFLGIGDSVKSAIEYGIDLLRDGAGIDVTAITFIVQICATIILFLVVRFRFWNVITGMIDKRRALIQQDIDSKDDAVRELEKAKNEAEVILKEAKDEASIIREKAVKSSKAESQEIMNNALMEIETKKQAAKLQIENDRQTMEDGIRDEIISVAYTLASKITEKEIDETKHEQLVNDFLKEVGK